MAHRLTGQMSAVSLTLGGVQNGTPVWGTAATLLGKRSTRARKTAKMADVSALEDSDDVQQTTRVGKTVDIELLIPDTGAQFEDKIGYYVHVEIKAKSSMTTPSVYGGVISDWSGDLPDGPSLERITITCGANGYTAPTG